MDARARVLELCRRGRAGEALSLQDGLERGRLRRVRERARVLLSGEGGAQAAPLFACGDYEPRRAAPGGPKDGPRVSYSGQILRLKALRDAERFARQEGAESLCGGLAVRLARGLRRLERAGAFGPGAPVLVSPVPGARSGPPAFGLCRVVERACALAGSAFAFRILLLRGLDLPPAHLRPGPRATGPHLDSLLPLRDPDAGGRAVVLVDDVASSGATLRASAALVGLFNGARTMGVALGRTPAVRKDSGAVRLL